MLLEKQALKEKIKHGNPMFPLKVYCNQIYAQKNVLFCHWHDEVEFIYMAAGQAVFYIDTVPVEVKQGQVVMVNRGQLHSGIMREEENCIYYALVFHLNIVKSKTNDLCQVRYIDPLDEGSYMFPKLISGSEEWEKDIIKDIKNIIDYYENQPEGFEIAIKSRILKIISVLYLNNGFLRVNRSIASQEQYKLDRFKKALEYIDTHYMKKISVAELAGEVNLSQYHFFRFFKMLAGKSPTDYINCYRVEKAAGMLLEGRCSVTEAALECGFGNTSYFIKTFKTYMGCTPSAYRRSRKVH